MSRVALRWALSCALVAGVAAWAADPGVVRMRYQAAEKAFEAGRWQEAIDILEKECLSVVPDPAELPLSGGRMLKYVPQVLLARARLKAGNVPGAMEARSDFLARGGTPRLAGRQWQRLEEELAGAGMGVPPLPQDEGGASAVATPQPARTPPPPEPTPVTRPASRSTAGPDLVPSPYQIVPKLLATGLQESADGLCTIEWEAPSGPAECMVEEAATSEFTNVQRHSWKCSSVFYLPRDLDPVGERVFLRVRFAGPGWVGPPSQGVECRRPSEASTQEPLLQPSDGEVPAGGTISLTWEPLAGAVRYLVEVTDPDGTIVASQRVSEPAVSLEAPREAGQLIVKIRAQDRDEVAGPTGVSSWFVMKIPERPISEVARLTLEETIPAIQRGEHVRALARLVVLRDELDRHAEFHLYVGILAWYCAQLGDPVPAEFGPTANAVQMSSFCRVKALVPAFVFPAEITQKFGPDLEAAFLRADGGN